MSWLSDHFFGKPKDLPAEDGGAPPVTPVNEIPATPLAASVPATAEIQSDTVTTSSNPIGGDDIATFSAYENREVAAEWHIPVRGKLHKVEFEHGTTSGRRILWIDEKVCRCEI